MDGAIVATRTVIPNYDQIILADNPVAYWPMDDPDTSTIFRDLSGNRLHATVLNPNGGTRQAGRMARGGAAFSWQDTQAPNCLYGRVGDSPLLRPSKITLEAWIEPVNFAKGSGVNVRYIIGKTAADNDFHGGYILAIGSGAASQGTVPTFCVNLLFGSGVTSVYPTSPLYLVGTYDGVNLQTYLNGVALGLIADNAGIADTTGMPLYLGRGDTSRAAGHTAARLAIYNYPLTQAQVTAHYNAGHV